jgi:uncharacterized membrane protein
MRRRLGSLPPDDRDLEMAVASEVRHGGDMERMLIATFDSEDQAREASRALEDLHWLGEIALNASAVVTRSFHNGTTVVETRVANVLATLGGMIAGGLLGLFGGPIGVVVGATAGFAIGAAVDIRRARVDNYFLAGVLSTLQRGKAALVADIDEDFTDPVDARMHALGGVVVRRDRITVEDREYASERKASQRRFRREIDKTIG